MIVSQQPGRHSSVIDRPPLKAYNICESIRNVFTNQNCSVCYTSKFLESNSPPLTRELNLSKVGHLITDTAWPHLLCCFIKANTWKVLEQWGRTHLFPAYICSLGKVQLLRWLGNQAKLLESDREMRAGTSLMHVPSLPDTQIYAE